MIINLLIFLASIFLVVHGATLATKYCAKIGKGFGVSRYVVGFIIVAFISILPETLISINAALAGLPAFGLGTLLGSNIADLTIIFALLVFISGRSIKIESRLLKNLNVYPLFLIAPVAFGLNAHYSRLEGLLLIAIGLVFYAMIFNDSVRLKEIPEKERIKLADVAKLLFSMSLLLVGAHFVVASSSFIAGVLSISPMLIGLVIVGLGTTIPELFFSLRAVNAKEDGLAAGDILGTVLADATIVIGILASIQPFYFPIKLVYVSGVVMVLAAVLLFRFLSSEKIFSKKEAIAMAVFWVAYILIELMVGF